MCQGAELHGPEQARHWSETEAKQEIEKMLPLFYILKSSILILLTLKIQDVKAIAYSGLHLKKII